MPQNGVNPMLDNETQLLVRIFQEVFQLENSVEYDPVKYVKTYESHIEEMGQLFVYLGLAKRDTQSALGWKPTHLLMEIIAQKVVRWPKLIDRFVCEEDTFIISLLCDAAFGEARSIRRYPAFSFKVLTALELVRGTTDGAVLSTRHLRQLFAEAYYDHRAKRKAKASDCGR
jgi:hypothetical protein